MRLRRGIRAVGLAAVALAVTVLAGCEGGGEMDDGSPRVVWRARRPLEGVPDAVSGRDSDAPANAFPMIADVPVKELVRKVGAKESLIATRPRHVMVHISMRLRERQDEVFFEQLLSDVTKKKFSLEGKDPHEAMQFLDDNFDDLMRLFERMPAAELSPGAQMTATGDGVYVIRLGGPMARGLALTELWLEQKGGTWRFVWAR